ncbi:hypothetical protein LTR37_008688 [Vermiconidia calcicola]|uniref:Uncharacterized protein n=1 Tax=Vermiconidia calcicola TaxID=1690605 RepID=A0ACC3NA58_9PEZI|nr:hypothetical protein LTR37_008688 [Vermiconidia calcicola]
MEPPQIRTTELYPLELHYVKALYLQQQHRKCIMTCRDVLRDHAATTLWNPLHQTFVRFYLAFASDELARAIHHLSQAKLPALNQAEQLYDEALSTLPSPEDCLDAIDECYSVTAQMPAAGAKLESRDTSLQSLSNNGISQSFSPPMHIRNNSLPTRSTPIASPSTSASDFDDLESHESFDQIMTPNRLPKLQRDFSSMHLLQPPQRPISHSLMRPVRMGSPAKPYHFPPRPLEGSSLHQQRSNLPKLDTAPNGSPVRKQLRTASEQASPVEDLVSPLESEGDSVESDAATISPISPGTPVPEAQFIQRRSEMDLESAYFYRVEYHLQAMRTQLNSHIKLLQDTKQKTLDIHVERSTARAVPGTGGRANSDIDASRATSRQLPQSRSYWSFQPQDLKAVEKFKRIEDGRNRGWSRKRFEPLRYRELAEVALAEL